MQDEAKVAAWQVRDSGLVTVPGRFRRLSGAVRHHRGEGDWPESVVLSIVDDGLVVDEVGRWPLAVVSGRLISHGPPVTFVLEGPAGAFLLAAPGTPATLRLIERLGLG